MFQLASAVPRAHNWHCLRSGHPRGCSRASSPRAWARSMRSGRAPRLVLNTPSSSLRGTKSEVSATPTIGSWIADSLLSCYQVIQVDAHAPFDKGWLVVRRFIHESARTGLLGGARSRSLGTEGAEVLPRWDPPDKLPSLALEYDMWRALKLVGSRIASNVRALVVPDSLDLGHLFEPFKGQASNP
jgi:hypothetical protein